MKYLPAFSSLLLVLLCCAAGVNALKIEELLFRQNEQQQQKLFVSSSLLQYSQQVTTSNFQSFLNKSCEICLLVFYEPNSASFYQARKEIESAAFLFLENHPSSKQSIQIGLIDTSLDPLLHYLYAPELLYTTTTTTTKFTSFIFNQFNHFPIILKLFKNSIFMEEYTDLIKSRNIVNYLLSWYGFIEINSLDNIHKFQSLFFNLVDPPYYFSIIYCSTSLITNQKNDFQNKKIFLIQTNCGITIENMSLDNNTMILFKQNQLIMHTNNMKEIEKTILNLINNTSFTFSEITPDNSWKFMSKYRYLGILLKDELSSSSSSSGNRISEYKEKIIGKATKRLEQPGNLLGLVECDGKLFAKQFGVDILPTFILMNVKTKKFSYLSKDNILKSDKLEKILQEQIDDKIQQEEYLIKNNNLRNKNEFFEKKIHPAIMKMMLLSPFNFPTKLFDVFKSKKKFKPYVDLLESIWLDEELNRQLKQNRKEFFEKIEKYSKFIFSMNQINKNLEEEEGEEIYENIKRFYIQLQKEQTPSHDRSCKEFEEFEFDRVDSNTLSMKDFYEKYSQKRIPVILTGIHPFPPQKEWTKSYLLEKCSNKTISNIVKRNSNMKTWGGFEKLNSKLTLGEFLNTFSINETIHNWYVHDNPILHLCPELLGEAPSFSNFIVPKYIAGSDYFQRNSPFSKFSHSWPSLFIGGNGTETGLHIDSGSTHFVMYLISGKKEWTVYDHKQIKELGYDLETNFFSHQSSTKISKWKGIQNSGELVFIPANSPHYVKNIQDTIGWSMNYVDLGNRMEYLKYLLLTNRFEEFEKVTNKNFPIGMSSQQNHLTYGEFKSQRWNNIELDIQ